MKKQYSPQVGQYIVKVKTSQSTDKWSDFDAARLQISVGQAYHEGEKLAAMFNWAAERFEEVEICVNDTLQRFNVEFERGYDAEKAYEVANQEGEEWLNRNSPLCNDKPNMSFTRWDHWLEDGYVEARKEMDKLYAGNPIFKQAITKNIMAIWGRRQKERPDLYQVDNFKKFFDLSERYLLEEITAFSNMYERKEAIDIYPGTTIFAATVFKGKKVEGAPKGLGKGHFCRIDFSKNKKYQQNLTSPNIVPKHSFGTIDAFKM